MPRFHLSILSGVYNVFTSTQRYTWFDPIHHLLGLTHPMRELFNILPPPITRSSMGHTMQFPIPTLVCIITKALVITLIYTQCTDYNMELTCKLKYGSIVQPCIWINHKYSCNHLMIQTTERIVLCFY